MSSSKLPPFIVVMTGKGQIFTRSDYSVILKGLGLDHAEQSIESALSTARRLGVERVILVQGKEPSDGPTAKTSRQVSNYGH